VTAVPWRGASRTTGLAVGVVAISSSPILVRLAHLPALALSFWRCLAGAAVLAPFALRSRRTPETGGASPPEAGQAPLPEAGKAPLPDAGKAPLPEAGQARGALGRREASLLVLSGALLAVHFALFNASLSFTTVASSSLLVTSSPLLLGRSARRRLPLATYAASVYGTAAAVLLPACLAAGARLGGYRAGSWLVLAGIVAGPQLLGHTVFNALLSTVTASVVAVVILTEPMGATLLAWVLFGEAPTAWFFAGAPLVLFGVWVAASRPGGPPDAPA
jgi:drug/metabolite transporter (DMT)-like permease